MQAMPRHRPCCWPQAMTAAHAMAQPKERRGVNHNLLSLPSTDYTNTCPSMSCERAEQQKHRTGVCTQF